MDYVKLGLKCGIEIHQQLDTSKLFCSCPSEVKENEPDVKAERVMRAVAGELGDVDPAALHEFLRDRKLVYEAYSDSTCLVELDEEPPHPINQEALDTVLQVALLLNAKPVDEIQVMRKTVIDGSNTSGFQRTMLAAMNGFLESSEGRIGIPTICLEEDAARKINEDGRTVTYRVDRLGIPLIEIATDPNIKTPQHAREVAEKIGLILRSTGRVKRGLGTIRQDLNVSIRNGARIEVKGVQDLKLISKIVKWEVERQVMLLEVRDELKKRKISKKDVCTEESAVSASRDITRILADTQTRFIRECMEQGGQVRGIRLKGFAGLLKNKLGPELAQYARSLSGVGGITHSDELPNKYITKEHVELISKQLSLGDNDAFAFVCGNETTCDNTIFEITRRCRLALDGVPEETRRARDDGTTEYMRPLPGSARMYPETDEPLIALDKERIAQLNANLPEVHEDKVNRYVDLGLSSELANQLSKSRETSFFDEVVEKHPRVNPTVVATLILAAPKEARKRHNAPIEKLTREHYDEILELLSNGKVSKDIIVELLAALAEKPRASALELAKEKGLTLLTDREVNSIVEKIVKENKELVNELGEKSVGPLTGKVMTEVKGRANAEKVRSLIAGSIKPK